MRGSRSVGRLPRIYRSSTARLSLVWIDNFLSKPETFLDRTLGRWDNLVVALKNTPLKLRERIHVKAFSVGEKFRRTEPQRHEDFKLKHEFWDPSFWKPARHP